jgi:hypothetical protein
MAAATAVTINDGLATPVAHTFAPAKTQADYALLEDRSGGSYISYGRLSFELKRPTGPSRSADRSLRLTVRIETPKLETLGTADSGLTPPPTIAYRPTVEVIYTLPERCLLQDRKDLLAYMKNLHSSSALIDAVEKFELLY